MPFVGTGRRCAIAGLGFIYSLLISLIPTWSDMYIESICYLSFIRQLIGVLTTCGSHRSRLAVSDVKLVLLSIGLCILCIVLRLFLYCVI